jgi:MYXO-CTERM domain-containing protein
MKMKTLSVLAGVSAPLIMTATAHAKFVGIPEPVKKDNPFGLWVVNVYAEFDNPGNDFMLAVAGTPANPLSITVIGGSFWNSPAGGDTAPTTFLTGLVPTLAYDSFYTIGMKAVPAGVVDATTVVNIPVLQGTSIATTNGSWAAVPPIAPQTNPFDPINSFPGNGLILIGQFTIPTSATGIVGSFLLDYVSDGVVTASAEGFQHPFPMPGALGLFGLAGLLSTRRRHR